jgi:hypothetical protein
MKGTQLNTPLVVTTNNPNLFDANGNSIAGGLGRPGTSILLGGNDLNSNSFSGGKFGLGAWLDSDNTIGIEGRGFFLGQSSFNRSFAGGPAGLPVVGIPVNNIFPINNLGPVGLTIPIGENAVTDSFPLVKVPGTPFFYGGFRGSDTVIAHTQLWGSEINGVFNVLRTDRWTVDAIAGFRYADLLENISLIGNTTSVVPVAAGGGVAFLNNFYDGTVTAFDSWRTRSQFYGGQAGFKAETQFGKVFASLSAQVALGSTHQELEIGGYSTLLTNAGMFAQSQGGTLNTVNNIGSYSRNQFSVIPEVELKLGYNITERMRISIGYDFFYWTNVAQAGAQTDRTVDLRQVPTIPIYDPTLHGTLPATQIRNSNITAQGLNFGIEFKF